MRCAPMYMTVTPYTSLHQFVCLRAPQKTRCPWKDLSYQHIDCAQEFHKNSTRAWNIHWSYKQYQFWRRRWTQSHSCGDSRSHDDDGGNYQASRKGNQALKLYLKMHPGLRFAVPNAQSPDRDDWYTDIKLNLQKAWDDVYSKKPTSASRKVDFSV